MSVLPQSFYDRECLEVAVDLLGQLVCHGPVVLRITEVEAYRHPGDTANHCRAGRTVRNAPMWGQAGHAYVYLCYGMHAMLNLVTDPAGCGAAVLIRAAEPVEGLEEIRARRGGKTGPELLTGPGKVAAALGLDTSFSGHALFQRRGLHLRAAPPAGAFMIGPRVGIDYAAPLDRAAPWRLALADTPWVSRRRGLRLWTAGPRAFLEAQRRPMDAPNRPAKPA